MRPDPALPTERRAGGVGARGSVARLRLSIYTAALGLALALDLLVQGRGEGRAFWVAAAGTGVTLLIGFRTGELALRVGAMAAAALAVAVPLVPALMAGTPLDAVLADLPLWPQILVALFASRVLAEDCEIRFARFWRAPGEVRGPVALQSTAAAVALGAALTLFFYQGLWWLGPAHPTGTSFGAIVLAALTGETFIHRAILFLFFVVVSFLFDASLRHGRDRAALGAVQAAARDCATAGHPLRAPGLRRLLAGSLAELAHLRALRLVEEACGQVEAGASVDRMLAAAAFDGFHASARRFIRALLPILPMLGFFGTVVGLATAMAALPTSAPDGGGVDISQSLSGLAVKFQTTLLGIMASLLASSLLALLDKSEAELAAECALFVAQAEAARAP